MSAELPPAGLFTRKLNTTGMTVDKDIVVAMNYVLKNDKGEVMDESGDTPMEYLHGHENIVPGLEKALTGLEVGAAKEVAVTPAEGYGDYDPTLKFEIPTSKIGGQAPPLDAVLQFADPSGHRFLARVFKVEGDTVSLDANHPLAGETLNFQVTITALRAASAEEISHGHVHSGSCGHHH